VSEQLSKHLYPWSALWDGQSTAAPVPEDEIDLVVERFGVDSGFPRVGEIHHETAFSATP